MRASLAENTLSASQISRRRRVRPFHSPGGRSLARKSKVSSIWEGMSAGSTSRRSLLRLSATARTWAVRKSSVRSASGTTPPGTASAARAASCAAVMRSVSQLMRKLATEGTKISTSASMTKTIVSSSSLADRPNPCRSAVAAGGHRGQSMALARSQRRRGQARASSKVSRATRHPRTSPRSYPSLASQATTLRTNGLAAALA